MAAIPFLCLMVATARPAAPPSSLTSRLQMIVDEQAKKYNTSFSLGLVLGGAPPISVFAGVGDHARGEPVHARSLYPLGSATKLYTAVACLQLAEAGKLDLDAPLHAIIDPFLNRTNGTSLLALWKGDARVNSITLRQVLSMRSGISDYVDPLVRKWTLDRRNAGKDLTPLDYLHADDLVPKGFEFEPGTGGACQGRTQCTPHLPSVPLSCGL